MFTLRAPSPPLTPPYTVGEGHDYPPGRRSHQQVTQAPSSWAFTLDYETMQWMQLDQNGDANSQQLAPGRVPCAQDEVRAMMLDYQRAPSRSHSVSSSTGDCDLELPTTGLVHQPRRTIAPSTTHPFIDGRLHRRRPWAIQRGLRRPARDRGTETVAAAAHTLIDLP